MAFYYWVNNNLQIMRNLHGYTAAKEDCPLNALAPNNVCKQETRLYFIEGNAAGESY